MDMKSSRVLFTANSPKKIMFVVKIGKYQKKKKKCFMLCKESHVYVIVHLLRASREEVCARKPVV